MQYIKLTKNQVASVDDEDYERLTRYSWEAMFNGYQYYARRTNKGKKIWMHREILNAPSDLEIDHINGNGIDNRKENLRLCTKGENQRHKGIAKNNTSGYKGVVFCKGNRYGKRKWKAQIKMNNKKRYIGLFGTKEEAARAYDEKAKELHGEFAFLNYIGDRGK